jgi:hypothetical protein
MFALPFLGAIAKSTNRPRCQMKSWHNCKDVTTYEEFMKVQNYKHDNMTYLPVGACKVWHSYNDVEGQRSGRACKQEDGSWKKVPDYSKVK